MVTLPIIMSGSLVSDLSVDQDLIAALKDMDIVTVNLNVQDGDRLDLVIVDHPDVAHLNVTAVDLIVIVTDRNAAVTAQELTDLILGLDVAMITTAMDEEDHLVAANVLLPDLAKKLMDLITIDLVAVAMALADPAVNTEDHATKIVAKGDHEMLTVKNVAILNLAAVEIKRIANVMII